MNHVVRSFDFDASVTHFAHIVHYGAETGGVGQGGAHEHVLGLAVVDVHIEFQFFKESRADAHVGLDLLFPAEFGIGKLCIAPTRRAVVVGCAGEGEVAVVAHFGVTRATHADFELEVGEPRRGAHEIFAGDVPHQTAADEDCRAVVLTETRGGIGAHRHVGSVFALEVPVGAAEEREVFVLRLRLRGGLGRLAVREEHQAVVGDTRNAGAETLRIVLNTFLAGEERDVVVLGNGELVFRRVRDGPHGAAAEALGTGTFLLTEHLSVAGQQAGAVAALGGIEAELRLNGQAFHRGELQVSVAVVHHVAVVQGIAFQHIDGVVHVARAPELMSCCCLGVVGVPIAREVGGERRE